MAGEDTAWLDQALADLDSAAGVLHDLRLVQAIRAAVDRHGGEPYPVDELAAITGLTAADARRVVAQLVDAGLAADAGRGRGPSTS